MCNIFKKKKWNVFFLIFTVIILFSNEAYANFDPQKYYLGSTYLAKSDSDIQQIQDGNIHYGWELGKFFMTGFTKVITSPNKPIIFLKNTGDKIALWFRLEQNINCLNSKESLCIDEGGVHKGRDRGLGTLCINYIDHQNLSYVIPYQNYLQALSVGADTNVTFFEEGDYEVSLDYRVRKAHINITSFLCWDVDIHTLPSHKNYRIMFKFSVRNGNCMVFLRDVKTQEELTNLAPNGFYLDSTKSRYLDINVKKEVLEDNSNKLDVRFNKPAKDGDQYTEKGVYTITIKNRYTKAVTTKIISVGNDPILNTYATTLLPISKIKKQIQNAANKNPTRIYPNSSLLSNIKTKEKADKIWFLGELIKFKRQFLEELLKFKRWIDNLISSFDISKVNNHKPNVVTENSNLSQESKTLQTKYNNLEQTTTPELSDLSQESKTSQEKFTEVLTENLKNKGYKVEKVEVKYLSQEYIEELKYNSLSNIYFGKSFSELEQQFQGEKYVFTLDKNNKTVVQKFIDQDTDILSPIIQDVAIGTGVILVATTISVASGGTISIVFAAAAKTGIYSALLSALCSSGIEGITTGIQTKNFDETVKAMAVAGAEGFKWGAISGTAIGGISKTKLIQKSAQLIGKNVATATTASTFGSSIAKAGSKLKSIANFSKSKIMKDRVSSLTKTGTNTIGKSSSNFSNSKIKTATTSAKTLGEKILKNIKKGTAFEKKVYKRLKIPKSDQQITLNGKPGKLGCTRADAIIQKDGKLIAVEIKSYDLRKKKNIENLIRELKKQVTKRAPHCSQQLIVLDKRKFSPKILRYAKKRILKELKNELQKLKMSDKKFSNISTDVLFKYM